MFSNHGFSSDRFSNERKRGDGHLSITPSDSDGFRSVPVFLSNEKDRCNGRVIKNVNAFLYFLVGASVCTPATGMANIFAVRAVPLPVITEPSSRRCFSRINERAGGEVSWLMSEVWIVRLPAFRVRPELVYQPSAEDRLEDFAFVVIPHSTAQFLVGHFRISLPRAPSFRYLVALHESELRLGVILPADQTRAGLSVT